VKIKELRLVFTQLVRLEAQLHGHVEAELRKEFGLVVSQFEALSVIGSHEGCQLRGVANWLSLTTGGASKLIDRVELAGLCRRRPNL
jgi:DNA-binding MarR family transcriptional regulator